MSSSFSVPSSPMMKKQRQGVKRCERACCLTLTYIPLVFVYGLTIWAIWVEASIGFVKRRPWWTGPWTSVLGALLFLLLSWSYTAAVFIDPGSPLSATEAGYSNLPTHQAPLSSAVTVKSTGGERFCKKCQARKPDRAHHCSTCKRCVLKMDHHCPWLATCLGLRNYKAFLLFLVYTTLFSYACFVVTMGWIWDQVLSDQQYYDTFMPINYLILAVTSGVFGLVLSGFTGWHISLALRNQTTIERLEKTRYLTNWRNSMNHHRRRQQHGFINGSTLSSSGYSEQLREIHANALPGITRPEEGIDSDNDDDEEGDLDTPTNSLINPHYNNHEHDDIESSPNADSPHQSLGNGSSNYAEIERRRERRRYQQYLDQHDSESLPHAFDLGWRSNLTHLFGTKPLLWILPVQTTIGDGWHWEPSKRWLSQREGLRRRRRDRRNNPRSL